MDGNQNKIVEVRRAFSQFPTRKEFYDCRNNLLSRSADYWTINAYQHIDDHEQNAGGIWALVVCENADEDATNGSVIGYEEYDDFTETFNAAMSFRDWVSIFNPNTQEDWLMVPKLFRLYLLTGKNLPALVATPDTWIDAFLRESRGMLMWTHQFIEMVRMIAGVSLIEATKIQTKYSIRERGWEKLFTHIYPPTNQTLLQIVEERTVGMKFLGRPHHLLAYELSQHLCAAQPSIFSLSTTTTAN